MPFYLIIALLVISPWVCGPFVSPSMAYDPVFLEESDWCYGYIGIGCWVLALITVGGKSIANRYGRQKKRFGKLDSRVLICGIIWIFFFLVLFAFAFNTSDVNYGNAIDANTELGQASRSLFIPWSLGASSTAKWSLFYSGFLMLGWATSTSLHSKRRLRVGLWILTLNFLVLGLTGSFFKLMQSGWVLGFIPVTNASFFGPFQYHNYFIGYNLLGIFLSFALFASYYRDNSLDHTARKNKCKLAICSFVTLFLMCITPLAGSRSGILLLIPTITILAVFAYRWRWLQLKNTETGRIDWDRVARLAVFVILFIGAGCFFGWDQIQKRLGPTQRHISELTDPDKVRPRILLQRDTAKMIRERPIWGFGPGSWQQTFPHFASDHFRATKWYHVESRYSDRYILVCNAHNDWLEFISNLGLVGFGLLISVPVYVLWSALRRGLQNWQYVLLFGPLLVAILSFWDAPLIHPAIMVMFVVQFVIATKNMSSVPDA